MTMIETTAPTTPTIIKYPAHFVDVEAVLIWLRYGLIENRPYGKTDDAYNEPASPNHGTPFLPVTMAVPLLMSSQTILNATALT
jgi:hypothetical protein